MVGLGAPDGACRGGTGTSSRFTGFIGTTGSGKGAQGHRAWPIQLQPISLNEKF